MKEIFKSSAHLHVQQVHEAFEIVLGFETRNKYRILDDRNTPVAFAAEQSSGITGTLLRQLLGHWRTFQVHIFDQSRTLQYKAKFPFRWFFKTLILQGPSGEHVGHIQERFAIFRKKFDVYNSHGKLVARINSSWFRFWTFEFEAHHKRLGKIEKKWSGVLSEFFTDKDNFLITFGADADEEFRALMLATCIMVDIVYFENKGSSRSSLLDLGN